MANPIDWREIPVVNLDRAIVLDGEGNRGALHSD
jgi:hypothetical protein